MLPDLGEDLPSPSAYPPWKYLPDLLRYQSLLILDPFELAIKINHRRQEYFLWLANAFIIWRELTFL